MHSSFAVEYFFSKKVGSQDHFLRYYLRGYGVYTECSTYKLKSRQDHPLRMRDGGLLISKTRSSTRILFPFVSLLSALAA